jgi:hypothetical protein
LWQNCGQGPHAAATGSRSLLDLDIVGGPARRLAFQAKLGGFALRLLSAGIRHRPLPQWDTRVRHVHSSLPFRPVEVILHRDASQHLAVGDADTFEVWFGPANPNSDHDHSQTEGENAANQPVAVFRGEYQVGVLHPNTSAAWRPLLHEGREASCTVVTFATRKAVPTSQMAR